MQQQNNQPAPVSVGNFILFAGVIMPAISISVEVWTHICAEMFFDPIPTFWHVVMVIFVPLAQLQVWFAIRRKDPHRLMLPGALNIAVIGISIYYSIVYLPLFPMALLALLIGFGILPMAPFLSLIAALVMRKRLKQLADTAPPKPFAFRTAGLLIGLSTTAVVIGLIELPATLTRYGLQMASSALPTTRAEGVRFLRSYGSREHLLQSCYDQSGAATDLLGGVFYLRSPVTPEHAREIYYRVTGETFDMSPPPHRVDSSLRLDDFDFDRDQGGTKVGTKLNGLSLSDSKIDGTVDADGGVGYLQWTLVFHNAAEVQREARTEIQLPPGGVVSRVTLWVNGEEREAAFAGHGQVREAYESVVRQRRDPVLVTTAGRDLVLVQCFPVPARGGEMKIRLGITVPLFLENKSQARLILPHFASRNFRLPNRFTHPYALDATAWLTNDHDRAQYARTKDGTLHFYGVLTDEELANPETAFRVSRSDSDQPAWSPNPFEVDGTIVKQSIEERTPAHLRRIVLVVDTSDSMAAWKREIVSALRALPYNVDVKLVLADGEGLDESGLKVASGREALFGELITAEFAGGADNVPALYKAWNLAAEAPGNNAIVWIHSPQLVALSSLEGLRHRWESRPYGPVLYSVKTTSGSDEIEKRLDGINEVKSVVRVGQLRTDLERLFEQLSGVTKTYEFVRSLKHLTAAPDEFEGIKASDHLARLWANDEVMRILNARDSSLNDSAVELAVRYQLVTPVTGAVVLENQQQYDAAGLKPVDAGTVPTIPEPEIVVLLIVGGLCLIFLAYLKYRKGGGGTCTV